MHFKSVKSKVCENAVGNLITSHPAENMSHDCSLLGNQKAMHVLQ